MAEKYQLGHGFEHIRLVVCRQNDPCSGEGRRASGPVEAKRNKACWCGGMPQGHTRVMGRRPGGGYQRGWTGENYRVKGGHEAEAEAEREDQKAQLHLGVWVLRKLGYPEDRIRSHPTTPRTTAPPPIRGQARTTSTPWALKPGKFSRELPSTIRCFG